MDFIQGNRDISAEVNYICVIIAQMKVAHEDSFSSHSRGLDGKACVLRSICESAHASFGYSNGILGELIHIIMT